MESVVDCVTNAKHGLIESPTGTGKTLSIICAAVAAVQKSRRDYAIRQANKKVGSEPTSAKNGSGSGDTTAGEDEEVKAGVAAAGTPGRGVPQDEEKKMKVDAQENAAAGKPGEGALDRDGEEEEEVAQTIIFCTRTHS